MMEGRIYFLPGCTGSGQNGYANCLVQYSTTVSAFASYLTALYEGGSSFAGLYWIRTSDPIDVNGHMFVHTRLLAILAKQLRHIGFAFLVIA